MVLAHLGSRAVLDGKNVVHYTLELADHVVASRYDSAITGISLSESWTFKEKIYEEIQEVSGHLLSLIHI